MTASQRLAALEARTRTDHRLNYDRVAALSEVEAVLPEIVAVVRAAEQNAEKNAVTYEMRDALAALDAKLGRTDDAWVMPPGMEP